MVTFSVPETAHGRRPFRFSVEGRNALLAGSRYRLLDPQLCRDVAEGLARLGFGFFVGCARGVDESFRSALADSPWREDTWVACAFRSRARAAHRQGLDAFVVVPDGVSPKVALYRRTLWMVRRCSLAVLWPERPQDLAWGPGSRLVLRSCLANLKPIFVAAGRPPRVPAAYHVRPADLFGVVRGYWVVADPYGEGGTCDDE